MEAQTYVDQIHRYERRGQILSEFCEAESLRQAFIKVIYIMPPSQENERLKESVAEITGVTGFIHSNQTVSTSAGVLNEFTISFEDRFDAVSRVLDRFDGARKEFQRATELTPEVLGRVVELYEDALMAADEHLTKMKATAGQFELPFYQHGENFQRQLASDIPFERTRKFMEFWLDKIEGPAHTAIIAHTKAANQTGQMYIPRPERRKSAMAVNSLKRLIN